MELLKHDAWLRGIDCTLVGLEFEGNKAKREHLLPYEQVADDMFAYKPTKERIRVIDSAILKCLKTKRKRV